MPKDKKSKQKKEGSSGQEVEIVIKRKNSIVDSSGGSSSSSSETSGSSSDQSSQSGDSDGSIGFEHEKGTMTGGDNVQGSSSSHPDLGNNCSVRIRDRTEEMRKLMDENAKNRPVRIVDNVHGVPITEFTHIVPISDQERDDGPSTSGSYPNREPAQPSCSSSKQNGKTAKNNFKQKQLTKKQRKELERKEFEISGAPAPIYPGQKERTKNPIEYVVEKERNNLHVHHFNEWSGDNVRDGEMVVRGTNAAAQSMLGQDTVAIPYLRHEDELGPPMHYTDLHKNSQMRYLRNVNTIGNYTGLPAALKPLHRMGYGIAASGIPDPEPHTLTINGAKPFMKYQYTDYVKSGAKIINWRSDFVSNADMDQTSQDETYVAIMMDHKKALENMIENTDDEFQKNMIIALRDLDLRQVLLRFGEIERIIVRRKQNYVFSDCFPRFDSLSRQARITYVVTQTLDWSTNLFLEKFEDDVTEERACSILMHLASTCPGEKPCYEDKHRKCSILHFLIHTTANKNIHLSHKFSGGNTLLHFAAMTGSPCQVDVLLRNGAPLNELNDLHKSPVALAIRRHTSLIARQLMWHGADIGGSLSLNHVQPRTPRQAANKELSEYHDYQAKSISYKAREFINQRLRALNNSFVSWVEAIIIDADGRVKLGVHSVKSGLHQVRIGQDILDRLVVVQNRTFVKKSFQMVIERSEFEEEPVVLFLIPCQYNRFDTTMPANFPHIVRVPMVTDALATAERIAAKEKKRIASGGVRVEYKDDLKGCRPIKLLGESVSISFGDGNVDRREILEPFFSFEHNGIIYAYNLPPIISNNLETKSKQVNVTVNLTIPETEGNRFKDCFFMVQAVQIVVREQPQPINPAFESSPNSFNLRPRDPRTDMIAEKVARMRTEKVIEEAARRNEVEMRDNRVRGIVADIESAIALKKSKSVRGEATTSVSSSNSASSSSQVYVKDKTVVHRFPSNSMKDFDKPPVSSNKTKTD
ncbi:ANK_REP_REGION domain-containing protein [Caenorhabditis elegans]|uniref:ANK_REP_REGION domain-containing protein n=1 Tax=Caenorhabditis elegans TaxID=6239 RepID=Q22974_CAEEL|nr:ANK_REP_REGION domain-containing protein [Caenorhabditis elegans]CCD70024.1 ANK_REP_REGION domain-containing protein [Caenorhabditis elegans]|eukprot:NP_505192.1 Uncharacterized protein CELE_F45F2.10 [Caenorhabditis elegans]